MEQANSSAAPHEHEIIDAEPLRVLPPACQRSKHTKLDLKDGTEYGLPEGWRVEQRLRTSTKYIGKVDQYFYEPGTRKQFRSLKSVLQYLNLQNQRNQQTLPEASLLEYSKTPQSTKPESSNKQKNKKRKSPSIDLSNPPEKITWVLTNDETHEWNPFNGETKLSEQEKLDWAETFLFISGGNNAPN